MFESFILRLTEALLTYVFMIALAFFASVCISAGHFPPTRQDMMDQVTRLRNFVEKSEQAMQGIKTINEQLATIGPKFGEIDQKFLDMSQKILFLEGEITALKQKQQAPIPAPSKSTGKRK